jgi:hypothetical protein
MHKYLILFFSVTLFLCACKSNGLPAGVIKPDAMAGLLTEIHIIDGRLYSGMQNPDTLYKFGMGNYLAAFERFHTDSGTFKKSLNYYTTAPDKLTAIYDQVDSKIKVISDSLNKVQTNERRAAMKADSLRNVHKADSLKKALKNPAKAAQRADSLKKAQKLLKVHKADSLKKEQKLKAHKADSLKKLKPKHPDALPKK